MKPFYNLGLIGYPLGHSFSPPMHQKALSVLGLMGSYHLFPLQPLPQGEWTLKDLLAKMRTGELDGLNVTIPHKQMVLPWMDELTPIARQIGAVNVIYQQAGQLIGDNTDSPAFFNDLYRHLPVLAMTTKNAIVLGAGGAARAVVFTLLQDGWQVRIAARRKKQAQQLTQSLGTEMVTVIDLSELKPKHVAGMSLMVNTTPVGMTPETDFSPLPEGFALPASIALYDLIYNPEETRLMHSFRQAGLAAVNGMGMLVEQAALSLERWTGVTAPRNEMLMSMQTQLERKRK